MPTATKPQIFDVTIERIVDETPDTKTFRLAFPGGQGFDFIPGQFVMLNFPDDPKTVRAYSIASSPLEKGYLEVTLNKVGAFTTRLHNAKPGDHLQAKGPFGKWLYEDGLKHAVLISGGTGITPFRCIARYVLAKNLPNKLTILYSSKTPKEIIYRQELEEFAKHPNIQVVNTITRPHTMAPGETWDGPTGRIDIEKVKALVPELDSASYYMCGPNQLIEAMSKALAENGVSKDHIRYEKWGEF